MKNKQLSFAFLSIFFVCILNSNAQSNNTDQESINSLLLKKRNFNKQNTTGYRIQLYNGSESRARTIKSNFQYDFRGVYTKLLYDAPDWKVQVGNYKTRLDADRALNKIKEKFKGGIIIRK